MTNTDPGYCHEHKTWLTVCENLKHGFETDDQFKKRQDETAHPMCPTCRCPRRVLTFLYY